MLATKNPVILQMQWWYAFVLIAQYLSKFTTTYHSLCFDLPFFALFSLGDVESKLPDFQGKREDKVPLCG